MGIISGLGQALSNIGNQLGQIPLVGGLLGLPFKLQGGLLQGLGGLAHRVMGNPITGGLVGSLLGGVAGMALGGGPLSPFGMMGAMAGAGLGGSLGSAIGGYNMLDDMSHGFNQYGNGMCSNGMGPMGSMLPLMMMGAMGGGGLMNPMMGMGGGMMPLLMGIMLGETMSGGNAAGACGSPCASARSFLF